MLPYNLRKNHAVFTPFKQSITSIFFWEFFSYFPNDVLWHETPVFLSYAFPTFKNEPNELFVFGISVWPIWLEFISIPLPPVHAIRSVRYRGQLCRGITATHNSRPFSSLQWLQWYQVKVHKSSFSVSCKAIIMLLFFLVVVFSRDIYLLWLKLIEDFNVRPRKRFPNSFSISMSLQEYLHYNFLNCYMLHC